MVGYLIFHACCVSKFRFDSIYYHSGADFANGFAEFAPCVHLALEWVEVVTQAEAGAWAKVDAEVSVEVETEFGFDAKVLF